ncbi:hypothetical protein FRB98_000956 [Tulasnella sp. 332]|nr:hypothetical protein FRB98_000956 [Tulasnella sp. 332]
MAAEPDTSWIPNYHFTLATKDRALHRSRCSTFWIQASLFNPYSLQDWAILNVPGVFVLLAAKLAFDQPRSLAGKLSRLLLLPVGSVLAYLIFTSYDFSGGVADQGAINFVAGCLGCAMVLKLYEFTALTSRPVYTPVRRTEKVQKDGDHSGDEKGRRESGAPATPGDVLHFLLDPRGVSYDFGAQIPRAPETRNVNSRSSFLLSTLYRAVFFFLMLDVSLVTFQSVPGTTVSTLAGGSLYNPDLPPLQRYLTSGLLVLCCGAAPYFGLSFFHYVITLLSVGIFRQDPAEHPFIFWSPHNATSVRELWGKRWHSLLRSAFVAMGYKPGSALVGEVGGLMGAFIVSGVLHDIGMWGYGKGTDPWRVVGFFWLQSVGIILEGIWRKIVGRRVQGVWGRLWTWTWVMCTVHIVAEAWLQRGVGGAVNFVPEDYRPAVYLQRYLASSISR